MGVAIHASAPIAPFGAAEAFSFLGPFPMADDDLELVAPAVQWIEPLLDGAYDAWTRQMDPETAEQITRQGLEQFVNACPDGHDPGDESRGRVPCYHFWMHLRPDGHRPLRIAGSVTLRVGYNSDLELYFGHVGYNVFPRVRGRRYAERACRLLLPLARHHGMDPLWITTDPDNWASRKTCERLGAELADVVDVPREHTLYRRGQRRKCRYRLDTGLGRR
jgi:predicted acetyltransferase